MALVMSLWSISASWACFICLAVMSTRRDSSIETRGVWAGVWTGVVTAEAVLFLFDFLKKFMMLLFCGGVECVVD